MADVIYLLLLLAAFGGFLLLVQGCDRIVRSGDDTTAADPVEANDRADATNPSTPTPEGAR